MKVDIQKIKAEIENLDLTIEQEAKAIVMWSFRGCPTLESIHAGEEQDIPENISRISEEEMKQIMKYAVDEAHFFLWLKKNRELVYKSSIIMGSEMTAHWDKPRNPWNMYQELLKDKTEVELVRIRRILGVMFLLFLIWFLLWIATLFWHI